MNEPVGKTECRIVIDELTGEETGVVKIDVGEWYEKHWIVDHEGDLRKNYKYRVIDEVDYDNCVTFDTHKVLTVKYRKRLMQFVDIGDCLWIFGAVGIATFLLFGLVMSFVVTFSDLVPVLKNSWWWQGGFWLTIATTMIGLVSVTTYFVCDNKLSEHRTEKDQLIDKWLEFKRKSEEGASK